MTPGERRLVSVRRRVGPADRERYDNAWHRYSEAANAAGANAWRFRAADEEHRYLEFLEFAGDDDPRGSRELAEAGAELQVIGPAEAEEWLEAR